MLTCEYLEYLFLNVELGPLDPNWFDTLTAQAFTKEENVSEQDELSVNQDGNFKTPLDKSALDSQFFSTPKVFRQSKAVSPEPERELSFTCEQGNFCQSFDKFIQ